MTIGEALKQERLKLSLTQKEMAAGIMSRSEYGKIEKDLHDISATILLNLLNFHEIDITAFIHKLGFSIANTTHIEEQLLQAFHENDSKKITLLQQKLSNFTNEELKIRALLMKASLEPKLYNIDSNISKKIQKYIFSNENWTTDIVALRYFGSSMPFFKRSYLDLHMKQLLKKVAPLSSLNIDIQERICAICGNYIFNTYTSPNNDIFNQALELMKSSSTHPHLWEYKVIAQYYKYYLDQDTHSCDNIRQLLKVTNETRVLDLLPPLH